MAADVAAADVAAADADVADAVDLRAAALVAAPEAPEAPEASGGRLSVPGPLMPGAVVAPASAWEPPVEVVVTLAPGSERRPSVSSSRPSEAPESNPRRLSVTSSGTSRPSSKLSATSPGATLRDAWEEASYRSPNFRDQPRVQRVAELGGGAAAAVDGGRRMSWGGLGSAAGMDSAQTPAPRRSAGPASMTLEDSLAASASTRKAKPLESSWRWSAFLHVCERVLQNTVFSTLMATLTVYVLVGDDIRLMRFDKSADVVFDAITIVCLVLFSLEIVLAVLVKEDYFPGFWFLADLFASASLILDLTFVSEALLGRSDIAVDGGGGQTGGNFEESEYARASRSSRVGSRIARILRVLRMARVSRAMKMFNRIALRCISRLMERKSGQEPGDDIDDSEGVLNEHAESRVGKKLGERTPQRVIVIVLALLVALPQLNPGDSNVMIPSAAQYGADVVLQTWLDFELAATGANASTWNGTDAAAWQGGGALAQSRWAWEVEMLSYIYAHAYDESSTWLHELCWVGYVSSVGAPLGDSLDVGTEGRLAGLGAAFLPPETAALPAAFRSVASEVARMVGQVPAEVLRRLAAPWDFDCSEPGVALGGVSLLPGVPCPRQSLRTSETSWYMPILHNRQLFDLHMESHFVFIFDVRGKSRWEAAFGVVQTVFVVIVLAIAALLFSRDVDKLVLHPIERMIGKVEVIRKDPLLATRLGENGDNAPPSSVKDRRNLSKLKATSVLLETQILENTIIKLGSLLALGFGDAGVNIIAENMFDSNARVTVKIPGTKVEAIFGFCDIRNFNVITDVLKERTMVFVNQVADIVHRVVDQHLGAANKNLGQSFLLVWQFNRFDSRRRRKLADLSVVAFVQVVSALTRDLKLSEMSAHPLLTSRMPGFRVSVGFGLHLGWAIAGAIGSEFKIDASYVSPHVNLATQLEDATDEYGVTMLMSEPLVRECNPDFRRCFRPIDNVQLPGSSKATQIFTVDMDTRYLRYVDRTSRRKPESRSQALKAREKRRADFLQESYRVHEVLVTDRYLRAMRQHLSLGFFQDFECGFLNYLAGEWGVASEVLGRTRVQLQARGGAEDGPSRCLLEYMAAFGNEAPPHWPGWRELVPRDRAAA